MFSKLNYNCKNLRKHDIPSDLYARNYIFCSISKYNTLLSVMLFLYSLYLLIQYEPIELLMARYITFKFRNCLYIIEST